MSKGERGKKWGRRREQGVRDGKVCKVQDFCYSLFTLFSQKCNHMFTSCFTYFLLQYHVHFLRLREI